MNVPKLYGQFVSERRYLRSVSPATLEWYKYSFKAFEAHIGQDFASGSELKAAVKAAVMTLASSKLSRSSINDYLRAIRAFLKWLHDEGHCSELIKLPYLSEPDKVIATLRPQDIQSLVNWKPNGFLEHRLYALCMLLADTGMRISEALGLERPDVRLDDLIIKVRGKGDRERLIPMSIMMRKILYRFLQKHESPVVFPTRTGQKMSKRNVLDEFHWLEKKLNITGVRFSPHTIRHSFSVGYLKRGGNALYLQRILGHSSLEMTNRYIKSLGVEDLQAVHNGLTLLG